MVLKINSKDVTFDLLFSLKHVHLNGSELWKSIMCRSSCLYNFHSKFLTGLQVHSKDFFHVFISMFVDRNLDEICRFLFDFVR